MADDEQSVDDIRNKEKQVSTTQIFLLVHVKCLHTYMESSLAKLEWYSIWFFWQFTQQERQQILEFETHLAAATSKVTITEANSLLISQLTTMDPK